MSTVSLVLMFPLSNFYRWRKKKEKQKAGWKEQLEDGKDGANQCWGNRPLAFEEPRCSRPKLPTAAGPESERIRAGKADDSPTFPTFIMFYTFPQLPDVSHVPDVPDVPHVP